MEVLREKDLCQKLKVSPNTLRKLRKSDSLFPKRVRIFGDAEGWLSDEIESWLRSLPRSAVDVRTRADL